MIHLYIETKDKYLDLLYSNTKYIKYTPETYSKSDILYILSSLPTKLLFLLNDNFNKNNKPYILTQYIKDLLNYPNSYLLLYNDWETKDLLLDKVEQNIVKFTSTYNIPIHKLIISTSEFLNINKLYINKKYNYKIQSYDWVYLRSKFQYSNLKRSTLKINKNKNIIFLNRRNTCERYTMATFYIIILKINFIYLT